MPEADRGRHHTVDPTADRQFTSFDGGVRIRSAMRRPGREASLQIEAGTTLIARGGGCSFAAASFGGGSVVLDMSDRDRVLDFAPEQRRLEVEAGASLGSLLALTAPHGLWLPVQPGYPAISVGGCIAGNVHGKNPARDGAFRHSVIDLVLHHPQHGTLRVDRDREPELFELTVGGYGLTGVILSATLRLEPLPGPRVVTHRLEVGGLAEALARLRQTGPKASLAYSWHDGSAAAERFGQGFVYEGVIPDGPPPDRGLDPPSWLFRSDSLRAPLSLLGPRTTSLLGAAFRRLERSRPSRRVLSLAEATFPLARWGHYYRLFGRRGLLQSQLLVPAGVSEDFLATLRQMVLEADVPVLSITLRLHRGRTRLLRFEGDGTIVTLDLPRRRETLDFLAELDRLAIETGAVPHLAKDSRIPRDVVRACYPGYDEFRERIRRHDPERIFRSELSERLGL